MSSKLIQIGSGIYDVFKDDLLTDKVSFSEPICVALMTSRHILSTTNKHWNEVRSSEAKGLGYGAGGMVLQGMTLMRDGGRIVLDADDLVWLATDVVVRHAVMYFQQRERLICSWDFRFNRKPKGSFFKLEWNRLGLISEDNPDVPPQYFTRYLKGEG